MPPRAEITTNYDPGTVTEVVQHDGSTIRLRKLTPDHDAHDRIAAMSYMQERQAQGEVVTGLLYVDPHPEDLHHNLNTVDTPLNQLGERELVPGAAALEKLNATLR